MFVEKQKEAQQEFWIAAQEIRKSPKSTFYSRLQETLNELGFEAEVRSICAPFYDASGKGRPGIDPAVYVKMIMIGFFEDLPSERAIASRCADSIAIRSFLKYELDESTPDHSSFTIIRQRLGQEAYQQIFEFTLGALQKHGLLRGQNVGLDSSVIEANASLRALIHRNTKEAYWEYVKKLAAEAGIDPEDDAAVRKFDRKRPGKGSNQEWMNPHDPDAKIGPRKDGGTDMIYKPEIVVDLDTGVIVHAEVNPGDHADHQDVSAKIFQAQETINAARQAPADDLTLETATADKGYYAVPELQALQAESIKTVIADPIDNRRVDKLEPEEQAAVRSAQRAVKSKRGKKLLARRGMHIERGFAHILDCGGMRRTTLRGRQNLSKRFKLASAVYNLSQLMRKLFGIGTPKQQEAFGLALLSLFFLLWGRITAITRRTFAPIASFLGHPGIVIDTRARSGSPYFCLSSTGC